MRLCSVNAVDLKDKESGFIYEFGNFCPGVNMVLIERLFLLLRWDVIIVLKIVLKELSDSEIFASKGRLFHSEALI